MNFRRIRISHRDVVRAECKKSRQSMALPQRFLARWRSTTRGFEAPARRRISDWGWFGAGYAQSKWSRFGIFTFGSVVAFITSVSPMTAVQEEKVGGEAVDLVREHGLGQRGQRPSLATVGRHVDTPDLAEARPCDAGRDRASPRDSG